MVGQDYWIGLDKYMVNVECYSILLDGRCIKLLLSFFWDACPPHLNLHTVLNGFGMEVCLALAGNVRHTGNRGVSLGLIRGHHVIYIYFNGVVLFSGSIYCLCGRYFFI